MNPGRELDALIVDKIMDLSCWKNDDGTWTAKTGFSYSEMPGYSEDISAAWPIALELHKKKLFLKLSVTRFGDDQRFCVTVEDQIGQTIAQEYSDNPAHAICLAALTTIKT